MRSDQKFGILFNRGFICIPNYYKKEITLIPSSPNVVLYPQREKVFPIPHNPLGRVGGVCT